MPQSTEKQSTFDPDNFEPITIGPVWKTDENGDWLLPERTLGWQVAGWVAENLVNDDDEPWTFTPEQFRFILWFYAVDEDGRFLYRDVTFQRLKGHG